MEFTQCQGLDPGPQHARQEPRPLHHSGEPALYPSAGAAAPRCLLSLVDTCPVGGDSTPAANLSIHSDHTGQPSDGLGRGKWLELV